MTDPTTMLLASAFASQPPAVRSEAPAVYDGAVGAVPSLNVAEAECLERMPAAVLRRSRPTISSACSGCTSMPPRSPPPGDCAGSATTPAARCTRPGFRARICSAVQAILEVHARWMAARLHCDGSPGDTHR